MAKERLFDLNIEVVLEHWGIEHAIREIIANALDEQKLTGTKKIEITYENKICHIRDYGRGIEYKHFTQNENIEKLTANNLIGKFGVGLKDALGVFNRYGVYVEINSKYSTITLTKSTKKDFDIETLHAVFNEPKYPDMIGTDFMLANVSLEDINKAKSMFLIFDSNITLLEKTDYGDVYLNNSDSDSSIYVNGVQIAIESNFMFTYNIKNINSQLKKSLNRERTNVGRSAYTTTIKNILTNCKSEEVLYRLVKDIDNCIKGTNKDETNWVDIASYAARTLDKSGRVVFMTPYERANLTNDQVEILQNSGKELVLVNDSVFSKINNHVSTFVNIKQEYMDSFHYIFIPYNSLNRSERNIFNQSKDIINLLIKKYKTSKPNIKISETIRVGIDGYTSDGIWDSSENTIIIKRAVLNNPQKFYGVLIHEFAHYISGYNDNSREFENVLTDMLGYIYEELSPKRFNLLNRLLK